MLAVQDEEEQMQMLINENKFELIIAYLTDSKVEQDVEVVWMTQVLVWKVQERLI